MKRLIKQVGMLCILLAMTTNLLKADMMFYYSAAVLPSIVGKKANQKILVAFDDGVHGMEPWSVDLKNNRTNLLKDLNQIEGSSSPRNLKVIGGKLYFTANDGIHGRKLWMYDPLDNTVGMIEDGIPGGLGSDIQNLIELDGKIFFTSGVYTNNTSGNELQKTLSMSVIGSYTAVKIDEAINGHIGSDQILAVDQKIYYVLNGALKSYNPNTKTKVVIKEGSIDNLRSINDVLFFTEGKQLYKKESNQNILIRESLFYIVDSLEVGNKLFFIEDVSTYNNTIEKYVYAYTELRVYDQLDSSIDLLHTFNKSIVDRQETKKLASFNGEALWVSDGTVEGTKFFKDTKKYTETRATLMNPFISDNKLYFVSGENGGEPWVSDGTLDGTRVFDIQYGNIGSYPTNFTELDNEVYFSAYSYQSKNIYKIDGTTEDIVQVTNYVKDDAFSVSNLITLNNSIFFSGSNAENGDELWTSDGTSEGTSLFYNITTASLASIRPFTDFIKMGKYYYFSANNGKGRHNLNSMLWKTDGTSDGTSIVKDTSYDQGLQPSSMTVVKEKLLFSARDDSSAKELWISDGSEEGTHCVKDINSDEKGSLPNALINVDNMLFFTADDGINGREIWKSDTTESGTMRVSDTSEDILGSYNIKLHTIQSMLYFVGKDNNLYHNNGTSTQVTRINSKDNSLLGNVKNLTVVGDKLFFTAKTNSSEVNRMYVIDNIEEGATVVKEIQNGAGYDTVKQLIKVGNNLFFMVNDGTHGSELWFTDGSSNGTHMVKDITPGDEYAHTKVSNMIEVNNTLYFVAYTDEAGSELWVSNGTENGTYIVKDIMPGNMGSTISFNRVHNGKLIFTATDSKSTELWISDGTEAGTKVLGTNNN